MEWQCRWATLGSPPISSQTWLLLSPGNVWGPMWLLFVLTPVATALMPAGHERSLPQRSRQQRSSASIILAVLKDQSLGQASLHAPSSFHQPIRELDRTPRHADEEYDGAAKPATIPLTATLQLPLHPRFNNKNSLRKLATIPRLPLSEKGHRRSFSFIPKDESF